MKRFVLCIVIFVLVVSVSACNQRAVTLENPESELFSLFYEGDDYSILKRIDIDPKAIYYGYAVYIGDEKEYCMVGDFHIKNYRVLYKDKYYDIVNGEKLGLYSSQDLIDIGIENISCKAEKE